MRTAIGKAKRGSFKNTGPDGLLTPILKHLVQTTPQVRPEQYGDVVIGTVLPPGGQVIRPLEASAARRGSPLTACTQGATEVRVASLLAGLPDVVPVTTVNRQCSSGLQAIANVGAAIKVLSAPLFSLSLSLCTVVELR